jgi:glutamate---cysteine ligase / carboxylate-amine ligase
MVDLDFVPSRPLTIGTELEWQVLDPSTGKLTNQSVSLLNKVHQERDSLAKQIIPESTQNMIEINSSVHESITSLLKELHLLQARMQQPLDELNLALSGGGTHPFDSWTKREIFPKERYLKLHQRYGFLFKRFSVYGQHIHVGCTSPEDMLYLIHALACYIPHFIALSAASPFYNGVDTFFECSRLTMVDSFPISGPMPFIQRWKHFAEYYEQLRKFKMIETIKDAYWDIRPKPNVGTIEIRVCDSPLTLKKAAALVGYVQALAAYLLDRKPEIHPMVYLPYNYNRFSAMRYGLKALIVDVETEELKPMDEDILKTLQNIKPYAEKLGSLEALEELSLLCKSGISDAVKERLIYKETKSLVAVVKNSIASWYK